MPRSLLHTGRDCSREVARTRTATLPRRRTRARGPRRQTRGPSGRRPRGSTPVASARGRPRRCAGAPGSTATARGRSGPTPESSAIRPASPAGRGAGRGASQLSSVPGRPSACASAAAIRAWPSALACRRSRLHIRGSEASSWAAKSTRIAPASSDTRRSSSSSESVRRRSIRANGPIARRCEMSGIVNVSTTHPRSTSARCIAPMSAAIARALKSRRSRSFMPATTVARSGRSASAGASWSLKICRAPCPRMPRFA